MRLLSTAEILCEYEEERERLLLEPPSKFRDAIVRNLEDAIAVLHGEDLPERSHKSKAMAADWLDRLAHSQNDVVARIDEETFRDPRLKRLTPRQLEIMQMVADGLSYSEIGDMLGISRYTVSTIVRRQRRKAVRI